MGRSEYLDSFEYAQGTIYREAVNTEYALLKREREREIEAWYEENLRFEEENKGSFLDHDPTYQAWIKERGAPPDCAALWQEACADFFFIQECDGVCSTCTRIKRFKGGLK